MEITQIVPAFSIGVLTVVLALVGVQVIRILQEFKKTVEKINKILEDLGRVTEDVSKPTLPLSGIFLGLKTGLKVLRIILKRKKPGEKK